MGAVFYLVLNMGITASAIGLIVLLARLLLRGRLPAAARYALWALVLVRLLLPFSLPSEMSALNPVGRFVTPIVSWPVEGSELTMTNSIGLAEGRAAATVTNFIGAARSYSPGAVRFKTAGAQSAFDGLGLAWLIGAAAVLTGAAALYTLTALRLKRARPVPDGGLMQECAARIGLRRRVGLYACDTLSSPAAFGVLRPRVLIPPDLADDREALRPVLLHELVHIKRLDTLRVLLFLLVCVHWYNPLVWLFWLTSGRDMELACDAAVLKRLDAADRRRYALALANLAGARRPVLAAAFGASAVKERVLAVVNYRRATGATAILSALFLLALAAALLTNPAIG